MRRITDNEIVFYDRVADRISRILGDRSCPHTQSSLAQRVGWNRASLCNFLNRADKTIAAHFIPRIAHTLHLTAGELINGDISAARQRNYWDPRSDEADVVVHELAELRKRKLPIVSLRRGLPEWVLPTRGMLVNYVDSIFNGGSPAAAGRWHEMIEAMQSVMSDGAETDDLHIIITDELLGPVNGAGVRESLSTEERVRVLDHLKHEWVRNRGFRFIAVKESMLTPDMKLEMAGNVSLTTFGRETRVDHRSDLRIYWDHHLPTVDFTRDCLLKLRRTAGLGTRQRPTAQEVERTIDGLLLRMDPGRSAFAPAVSAARKLPVFSEPRFLAAS